MPRKEADKYARYGCKGKEDFWFGYKKNLCADMREGLIIKLAIMKARGCHSGAIMRNNMKGKNKDKDKWLSKVRAPIEGLFSKDERRARYRGLAKVQFQGFLEAIVHNVKRMVKVGCQPLVFEVV